MDQCAIVEDKFKKNPDLKNEHLDSLRAWLNESKPDIPCIPEDLLILFLHSCYYNLEKTKKCIDIYYQLRKEGTEIFSNRNPNNPKLKKALSVLDFCIFPARDPNGYVIIYHKLKICDPSQYVFADGVTLLIMAMDAVLHMYGTLPGIVLLFDMRGVRFGHLLRLSFSTLKRLFVYVQEGNPVRLKAIHVANTSSLIDKIMVIIKPFMKKELFDILHFHTGDNATLNDFLPKYCLPADYGGELDSVEAMHEEFTKCLEDLLPYFQEEEEYRNVC